MPIGPVGTKNGYYPVSCAKWEAGENAEACVVIFTREKTGAPFGGDNAEESACFRQWGGTLALFPRVGAYDVVVFDGIVDSSKGAQSGFSLSFKKSCSLRVELTICAYKYVDMELLKEQEEKVKFGVS